MKTLKRVLPSILFILLEIAIGVLMIIDAEQLTVLIFTLFGIALVVFALVMLIRYLKARKVGEDSSFTLVTAIIAFVFGLVLAFGATLIVDAGYKLFAIFYGAVLIVEGCLKIGEFISMKKQGAAAPGILILSGIISIALGIVAIVFNYLTINVIGLIVGITLLAEAILDIVVLILSHRVKKSLSIYDTSGDDKDYDYDED